MHNIIIMHLGVVAISVGVGILHGIPAGLVTFGSIELVGGIIGWASDTL